MVKKLSSNIKLEFEVARLDPLFASREAYEKFTERQNQYSVAKRDFSTYEGNCFLGIDAGSTTTKAAVQNEHPLDVLHLMFGGSQVQKPYRASTNGFLSLTLASSSLMMTRAMDL